MRHMRQTESSKPEILVTVPDDSDVFGFMSVGWYDYKSRGKPEAEALMRLAKAAIEAATDVPDAIARLEKEGFRVTRG